jgi:oxaloacetate decarboxylase gamma subunit
MDENLLLQGLELMLVGMGTVFAFLTLLVLATGLMSSLIGRRQEPAAADAGPTEEEIAAIAAAIDRHRRR